MTQPLLPHISDVYAEIDRLRALGTPEALAEMKLLHKGFRNAASLVGMAVNRLDVKFKNRARSKRVRELLAQAPSA